MTNDIAYWKKYGFLRAGSEIVNVDPREQVRRLAIQVAISATTRTNKPFEVRRPRH